MYEEFSNLCLKNTTLKLICYNTSTLHEITPPITACKAYIDDQICNQFCRENCESNHNIQ